MGKFRAWILCVWLASKWIFRVTLCDNVIYKGEKYHLINGNMSESWTAQKYLYGPVYYIPKKEVKKIWSIKGMIQSFKSGYFFYKTSWLDIWARNGIEPWMLGCDIWANKGD